MARIDTLTNFLTDVSTAIKQKTGGSNPIPASQFDTEILSITTGGNYQTKSQPITTNGNYIITPDTGYDAIEQLNLSVAVNPILQNKTITENGTYIADSGYDGLDTVTVNVPSSSGDIKLFTTEQAMQADSDPHEGDLAVVYREEIQPVTEESEFDSCIFPNTVVLDEAFSDNVFGSFRSTGGGFFDGMVDTSSSSFRFDGWGETMIRVQYTSNDGITYTRTDGGEELQEFGTTIKWESWGDPFNDVIGNFMKIGGNYFEGLYEYGPFVRNIVAFNTENIDVTTSPYINVTNTNIKVKVDTLDKCCKAARRYLCGGDDYIFQGDFYLTSDLQNIIYVGNYSLTYSDRYVSIQQLFMNITNNKIYLPVSSNRSDLRDTNNKILNYNIENETITEITLQGDTTFVDANSNSYSCKEFSGYFLAANSYSGYTINWITDNANVYNYLNWENNNSKKVQLKEINTSIYAPAKTQLDATSDYVYEKTFYGKNGVENGTLTTNVSNSFMDVNAEVYTKIQEQYDSMQPRIAANQERIDTSTKCIPCKSDGTPLLDTSNVTNMKEMFYGCKNLITIPLLDTSNVTNMKEMFVNCEKLSKLPLLDTSNVTDMNNMFYRCFALKTIPLLDTSNVINMGWTFMSCGIEELPSLDTSNVTDMSRTFDGCSHLVILPQLDTSSVTSMDNAFYGCTSLSNTSLNNILVMCANSAITSTKTLNNIGLTEEQATICTTLSNYQAFVNAGWTTGY